MLPALCPHCLFPVTNHGHRVMGTVVVCPNLRSKPFLNTELRKADKYLSSLKSSTWGRGWQISDPKERGEAAQWLIEQMRGVLYDSE